MNEPVIVYLVDDDESVRSALLRLLKSAGYRARAFATAQALVAEQPPDDGPVVDLTENFAKLTPRERQVFALVISGLINKEVAWELGISEKTIKVHRARVVEKMGARSLPDLVRMAGRLGLPSERPAETTGARAG